MSMLARFTPASPVTTEQYDETIQRLEQGGDFPPDGLEYHVAFMAADGGLRVSESGSHSGSSRRLVSA